MFTASRIMRSIENSSDNISHLKAALEAADTVIIGAGAGLSTAAGYIYTGERFEKYFSDFAKRYGFRDMYTGGFFPYASLEENWAYWSRYIYVNRYMDIPSKLYSKLYELVKDKDYFVLTTNVDHCFQRSGFDKSRLFYTQGDYGLWQCSKPCHNKTYENAEAVREMLLAQGFEIAENGELLIPQGAVLKTEIPKELVPRCPVCGQPMSMNLRADDTFIEDNGWHEHASAYSKFLRSHRRTKTLFLELGVGYNTPVIIKYPFWQMTKDWPDAAYACLNRSKAAAPAEIRAKAICINNDIAATLEML